MITLQVTGVERTLLRLRNIRANIPKVTKNTSLRIAKYAHKTAKQIINSQSVYHGDTPGRLANGFHIKAIPNGYTLWNSVPYAKAVDQGTQGHFIFSRGDKPMVFEVDGRKIVTHFVNHPGATPMHFVEQTIQKTIPYAKKIALEEIKKLKR